MTEGPFFEENQPHMVGMTPIRWTKQKSPTRFNFCKHDGIIRYGGGFFCMAGGRRSAPRGAALGTGAGDGQARGQECACRGFCIFRLDQICHKGYGVMLKEACTSKTV